MNVTFKFNKLPEKMVPDKKKEKEGEEIKHHCKTNQSFTSIQIIYLTVADYLKNR